MQKKKTSKWIEDLNVRPKTKKLLEENRQNTFSDINHSKILYDPSPRVMEIKVKINIHEGAGFGNVSEGTGSLLASA